jgi:hypothetical protein
VDYAGLTAGSHTFQVRATDPAGNVSASTSYTWTANTDIPNVAIDFPTPSGLYNDSGFDAGCGTPRPATSAAPPATPGPSRRSR